MLSVLRKKRSRRNIQRSIYFNLKKSDDKSEIVKIIDNFIKDKDIDVYDLQNLYYHPFPKQDTYTTDEIWIDIKKIDEKYGSKFYRLYE